MSIETVQISKTFGDYVALRDVSLRIDDGELIALLGPSGSGKTTLLRILAGLETPDPDPQSKILFSGVDVGRHRVGDRRVGFVFQHYALFKHMSVFENVAFGLRVRPRSSRPSREVIRERVKELLQLIQLDGFSDRYPSQLSGGQRQRVALARALAIQPRVLLLDEPFGALDAKVRQGLRNWLRKLHDELKMTTILVTHDQEEALEVADRVVVMNLAKIEQVGTPEEVFHHPATEFVMDFLGSVNVFHERNRVYIRPHELKISRDPIDGSWPATVVRLNPAGSFAKVFVETSDAREIQIDLALDKFRLLNLAIDQRVYVSATNTTTFKPERDV